MEKVNTKAKLDNDLVLGIYKWVNIQRNPERYKPFGVSLFYEKIIPR